MIKYINIDPIVFALGPLQIRWYGLMYLVGFAAAWWLGRIRADRLGPEGAYRRIDDLIFYGVLGAVLGGRVGYVLFYQVERLVQDPVYLLRIWEGGMSFHGGLLGVILALYLFGRRHGLGLFQVSDFVAPLVPIGLGAGRIGNFINGELWGRVTNLSWGVQLPCGSFPSYCRGLPPDALWSVPVHASQLYEAVMEGLVLFLILWVFTQRPRPVMAASGLFLLGYGLFRFVVEFVRQPDAHLGFVALDWLTMGQLLSMPMIVAGLLLMGLAYRARQPRTM